MVPLHRQSQRLRFPYYKVKDNVVRSTFFLLRGRCNLFFERCAGCFGEDCASIEEFDKKVSSQPESDVVTIP